MSIFRPVLDQELIAKILELKPKYMTATVFLNSMLEDAYKARCKELQYMAQYISVSYTHLTLPTICSV